MDHVIYSVRINLMPPFVRCPSKEKKQEHKILHPYQSVRAIISESYICPFCGNIIKDFHCNCEEFQTAFKKLQEFQKDNSHKSELHYSPFHESLGYEKDIKSISLKELSKKDIEKLGPDIWDCATKFTDHFCESSYLVTAGEYVDNTVSFICKDIKTKKVYLCTMNDINFSGLNIRLGVWCEKTVSDGAFDGEMRCGNYHFESGYEDIVTFENWEQFCKILLAM